MEISQTIIKVKSIIENMLNFLETSWKGFTCVLCNGEHHQHFNSKKKSINGDLNFCRSLVSNSLPALLY